jgi:hypothetical protein
VQGACAREGDGERVSLTYSQTSSLLPTTIIASQEHDSSQQADGGQNPILPCSFLSSSPPKKTEFVTLVFFM